MKELSHAELAEHLIGLPDEDWSFWRCVGLRGAGFPAKDILKLGAPEGASSADRLLEAEEEADLVRRQALQEIYASLDLIRLNYKPEDKEKRNRLLNLAKLLKMGKLPPASMNGQVGEILNKLSEYSDCVTSARKSYNKAYRDSVVQTSRVIREVLSFDSFREAFIWQNRHAYNRVERSFARKSSESDSRNTDQRRDEELIASYLQRYCVKNDTIGFFGPVGWARFVDEGPSLTCVPGVKQLATRNVYFENWCIESLANEIAKRKAIRPWIIPVRMPFLRVESLSLYHPLFGSTKLSVDHAAILKACNGTKTARDISREIIRSPHATLSDETQVYTLLEKMAAQGLIFWNFNVPVEAYPERTLRRLLNGVEDEQARLPALAALSELESARAAVASAAGDPEMLDRTLGELESVFARLTGKASTRSGGKTYAARTLVYEDCRRDNEVEIGPGILDALAPPLSLLLTSARWYTYEFAQLYRKKFKEIYANLIQKAPDATVEASQFWMEALPYFFGDQSHYGNTLEADFQARWEEILSVPYQESRVQYTVERLRPLIHSAFAAPGPGWLSARYHCPDVMIAATGLDAIQRGDYQLVMGEIHLGGSTLGGSTFVEQHPSPSDLIRYTEADLPGKKALPMTPKDFPGLTARTNYVLISPDDFRIEFTRDSFVTDRSKALPIASLVIEERENDLIVCTRDGQHEFDLIEVVGGMLQGKVVNSFSVQSPHPHIPRITIGELIICRETWQFAPDDLKFAFEKDGADRFLAARRWARSHSMPRFVFVKVPVEVKPFYVDFSSPIYVDILSRMARRTAEANSAEATVKITEMLPTPDLTWLPDAQGKLYTSELRIIAVDLAISTDSI